MPKLKNEIRYQQRKMLFNIADQLVKDENARNLLLSILSPLSGSNNGVLSPKECIACNEVRSALIIALKEGSSVDGYMPKKTRKEFKKTWGRHA
tara:strand:- start:1677 stop:1958 length:282 start_codon:yes stop_codon:yes gene_type:complete